MKISLMLVVVGLGLATQTLGQNLEDLTQIENSVRNFAGYADQRDAAGLEALLHPQFRAVVNRAFGSAEVSLIDKASYLQLLREEKIGGDTRDVRLLSIDLMQQNATVKAIFSGQTLRFITVISLVKTPAGSWQVIADFPTIESI